jgi:hypothetical protein
MEKIDNGIKSVNFRDIFRYEVEAILPVYLDAKGNRVIEPARPQDHILTNNHELLISPERKDINEGNIIRVIDTDEYYEVTEVINDKHTWFLTKELK